MRTKIPLKYYDLIISTYVVPHIPKYKLNDYFSSINKYLKDDGIFYFDFMPSPLCLMQNLTTFTYPYSLIINELNQAGLKIIKTTGSGVFVKKMKELERQICIFLKIKIIKLTVF